MSIIPTLKRSISSLLKRVRALTLCVAALHVNAMQAAALPTGAASITDLLEESFSQLDYQCVDYLLGGEKLSDDQVVTFCNAVKKEYQEKFWSVRVIDLSNQSIGKKAVLELINCPAFISTLKLNLTRTKILTEDLWGIIEAIKNSTTIGSYRDLMQISAQFEAPCTEVNIMVDSDQYERFEEDREKKKRAFDGAFFTDQKFTISYANGSYTEGIKWVRLKEA